MRWNVLFPVWAIAALGAPAAGAAEPDCKKPPKFVGVPTGAAAWSTTGEAVAASDERYYNFGDHLVVSGGEGGLRAVTLHGENECGLWLQHTSGGSYVTDEGKKLREPTYTVVKAKKAGVYVIEALGVTLRAERAFPGRFRVVLETAIRPYEGE